MQGHTSGDCACRYGIRALREKLAAIQIAIASCGRDGVEIKAGLRIREVDVVSGQQPMTLGTNVSDLEYQIPRQLALNIGSAFWAGTRRRAKLGGIRTNLSAGRAAGLERH